MQTISATEAKRRFDVVLDVAQREPVRIQRYDRDVAVLVSVAEFDRLNSNRWKEFNRLKELAGAQAHANGQTEEILAEILASH
ncbi:type II toxin-antitoxin system Phd/YefM family antitoxin [Acidicapsa dinghuensis]|uniref:Antitoxin n=1 Tax=Acidicapsa dinghuensis TaxID=2218256 RepID=A0ABW1EB29_9BACT|nr:type II toxin-antitoxin system Phd/YefM family antitoxin [Acidicapsa dinghuensis]